MSKNNIGSGMGSTWSVGYSPRRLNWFDGPLSLNATDPIRIAENRKNAGNGARLAEGRTRRIKPVSLPKLSWEKQSND